jgi:uncharacterized protein YdaL
MIHPRDEYQVLKNVNNIDEQAYFTLFEKYIIQNLKGEDKLFEIDSTDQETVIGKRNGGYPVPGFIYTFLYKGPKAFIEIKNDRFEYTDLVPLTFCMNNDMGNFSGINLNLLPPDARLRFLGSFYETFEEFFKNVEDLTENNKEAFNKRFISLIKSGGGQTMIKMFSKKNGANFNFAYRKYLIQKVDRFRMVEYSEWKFIPFYEPKDAFRKLNQAEIYKLYSKAR